MDQSIYGQKSTFHASDSTLHVGIEDLITKYPNWQFPLLKRLNSSVFKNEVTSHKYEWTEEELRPTKAKVASKSVGADDTSFYVDTPGVFNTDDVLRAPDGEIMIVTQVAGGTLIIVRRAWGGTTAETMVLGETVQRIGVASPQGKDADDMVVIGPRDLYNLTQIFEDVVHLSGTQEASLIHGDASSATELSKKQKELAELLQSAMFAGVRYKDAAEKRTTLGGLKWFIDEYAPNNAIDFGGATTWSSDTSVIDKFEDAVQAIADNMGGKPVVYIGYKAMRKFKNLDDDLLKTSRGDKKRGIGVVSNFLSMLGDLDVVMMRERTGVLDDLIFFVDEEQIGYKPMRKRGWFTEKLAKTGDSHKWQVLGEYTMKVATPKVHSYIYNLGL